MGHASESSISSMISHTTSSLLWNVSNVDLCGSMLADTVLLFHDRSLDNCNRISITIESRSHHQNELQSMNLFTDSKIHFHKISAKQLRTFSNHLTETTQPPPPNPPQSKNPTNQWKIWKNFFFVSFELVCNISVVNWVFVPTSLIVLNIPVLGKGRTSPNLT